jgi:hypothetical protein
VSSMVYLNLPRKLITVFCFIADFFENLFHP